MPKVISEMVGQTCRFAAAPGRAPPTISEMTFGNHSNLGAERSNLPKKRLRKPLFGSFRSFRSFGANTSSPRCAYGGGYVRRHVSRTAEPELCSVLRVPCLDRWWGERPREPTVGRAIACAERPIFTALSSPRPTRGSPHLTCTEYATRKRPPAQQSPPDL